MKNSPSNEDFFLLKASEETKVNKGQEGATETQHQGQRTLLSPQTPSEVDNE